LYRDGFKISKIAQLADTEISKMVKQRDVSEKESYALDNLKSAMLSFDTTLFNQTFNDLLRDQSFTEIYSNIFIPFLNEIGMLWQTFSIDPTHERFISELIKQKIILHTEKMKSEVPSSHSTRFALFLPYNEIHEIGLLYANYELVKKGLSTIYLGTNIPLNSLSHVTQQFPNTVFITYLTMEPEDMDINTYISNFNEKVANKDLVSLWLIGKEAHTIDANSLSSNIKTLSTLNSLQAQLEDFNDPSH
jgi:methanogenic corrinoid protein MtbC1